MINLVCLFIVADLIVQHDDFMKVCETWTYTCNDVLPDGFRCKEALQGYLHNTSVMFGKSNPAYFIGSLQSEAEFHNVVVLSPTKRDLFLQLQENK